MKRYDKSVLKLSFNDLGVTVPPPVRSQGMRPGASRALADPSWSHPGDRSRLVALTDAAPTGRRT